MIALGMLIVGIVAARVATAAVGSVLGVLDRRAARLATSDRTLLSPRLISATRSIVFWSILALTVTYALRTLGVGSIATMLTSIIDFIPQLLVGALIVVAGHVVGLIASRVVAELSDDITTESLGPRLLHGAIVVVSVVMGLQHIHVDISFITQLMLIAVAIVGSGLMLAFALGARQHVANLLARRELGRLLVGDRIRVDGVEGDVVEVHPTGVDVATDEGVVSIPGARLTEVAVLRIGKTDGRA